MIVITYFIWRKEACGLDEAEFFLQLSNCFGKVLYFKLWTSSVIDVELLLWTYNWVWQCSLKFIFAFALAQLHNFIWPSSTWSTESCTIMFESDELVCVKRENHKLMFKLAVFDDNVAKLVPESQVLAHRRNS